LENASPLPIAATMALEMIGPMPGTLTSRSHPTSCRAMTVISSDKRIDTLIKPAPVFGQTFNDAHDARRQHVRRRGENARQLGTQEPQALPHGDAALEEKGSDLIDDAGTLTD